VALGWSRESIIVIDEDQGQSAASVGRAGFQRLVAEVGLGHAGIVMSLEASRLARNSSDWHRLLEICAVTQTLILDEDGVYDPAHFNDRLLLGLKGTLSEVELHMLRARLMGGLLNKAKRGELRLRLPIGFVYDLEGRVTLDPDQRVRESLRLLFRTFVRVGSVFRTVKEFNTQGFQFPLRVFGGPGKGELFWGPLTVSRANYILHNPRYAGAYVYRRRTHHRGPDGRLVVRWLEPEEWHTLIRDAHEGYIRWEEYEANRERMKANSTGTWKWKYPPREGPALLQGLAVCGRCGRKMQVRYHRRKGGVMPDYTCRGDGYKFGESGCQSISGGRIDEAVGELLMEAMKPVGLEVALAVQQELEDRIEEADALRRK
jgi:DNA invertase Pin-like site-specific DNA recombinase